MNNSKAWSVTIFAFLACVVFAAGSFKVPPTMLMVIEDMNVGVTMGGVLMSMQTIAGIILVLVAGGIVVKNGPKKVAIFALACLPIGNVVGALAPNFSLLLVGRLIEGIGFAFIVVAAPALVNVWFPPEKRGLPMAIFSTWSGVGMTFIFNISNVITPHYGWRGVWWLVAILGAIIMALFIWRVEMPASEPGSAQHDQGHAQPVSMLDGFKSPASWLLAVVFSVFVFGMTTLATFLPTFLVEELGMDVATANMNTSMVTVAMIVGGILMGFVLNAIKNRYAILMLGMIVVAVVMYMTFKASTAAVVLPLMIITGLAFSIIPAVVLTIMPDTAVSPATAGISISLAFFGQNISASIAPIIIGAVVESSGGNWDAATLPLIVAACIGVIACLLTIMTMKKKSKSMPFSI